MDIYVARQPIFNKKLEVYGYELLYRSASKSGQTNIEINGDQATAAVIVNSFMSMNISEIGRNKIIFINFNKKLLDQGAALLISSKQLAVEIVGSVVPDLQTVAACADLKRLGYLIVLDDFTTDTRMLPLLNIADIVKVDFLETSSQERKEIFSFLGPYQKKITAKRLETPEHYRQAIELGCTYFQGYFFSKPELIGAQEIPESKARLLQVLQEINRLETDLDLLEKLIKQDVSLSYKLLKYINTTAFEARIPIPTIQRAIAYLGKKQLSKWASLVLLRDLGENRPDELVVTATIRARFCEELALLAGFKKQSEELYIVGLFSLLDALLGRPMAEILEEIPLASEVKSVLNGDVNAYSDIYRLVLAYEVGNWVLVDELKTKLNLIWEDLSAVYLRTLSTDNL